VYITFLVDVLSLYIRYFALIWAVCDLYNFIPDCLSFSQICPQYSKCIKYQIFGIIKSGTLISRLYLPIQSVEVSLMSGRDESHIAGVINRQLDGRPQTSSSFYLTVDRLIAL